MAMLFEEEDMMEEDVEDIFVLFTEVVEDFLTVVLELMVFVEVAAWDWVDDTDLLTCDEEVKEEEEVVCTEPEPES